MTTIKQDEVHNIQGYLTRHRQYVMNVSCNRIFYAQDTYEVIRMQFVVSRNMTTLTSPIMENFYAHTR